MNNIFSYLCFFLLLTSCKKTESKPLENERITEKINQMYSFDKTWGNSTKAIVPKGLFTSDIENSLNQILNITETDIQTIKNSNSPTDKPLLYEGSVFTSLYEGSTTYKIKSIDIKNGKNADAIVTLENSIYKKIWTDKVELVNNNGWRIKNVIFDKTVNKTPGDLKTNLNNFISYTGGANK